MTNVVEYHDKKGDIMANLSTNLKGRLNNTNLPVTKSLFPLFEAVVNSIHATDDRVRIGGLSATDRVIKVSVLRDGQTDALSDGRKTAQVIGFEIEDNGIGFDEVNYNSFCTLDSEHKADRGCRGIGRLLWLKAFHHIDIDSHFVDVDDVVRRRFKFSGSRNIYDDTLVKEGQSVKTKVALNGIQPAYKKGVQKTTETIAKELMEHCLWYFIRDDGAPKITIVDGDGRIDLLDLFSEYMVNASETEIIEIKSEKFEITHVKLKSTPSSSKHAVIYSAADRVVSETPLTGKITGLFGVLHDGNDDFNYRCFVTSKFLNERVTPERLGFNIADIASELFSSEVAWHDIDSSITACATAYLDEYLTDNKKAGKKRVVDFVSTKAPRYRPILDYIAETDQIVDPDISDKDLELILHKILMQIESDCLAEGHDLLKPDAGESDDCYSERVSEYLSKAGNLKQSDLASYVARRRVVLDLLSKAIELQNDGKYDKEDVIHNLIMPMGKDSKQIFAEDSNLWLIDERLAFHNYLGSDKALKTMPISDTSSAKQPDVVALNVYDNPMLVNDREGLPLASLTVIEIKRPMRNDISSGEDKNPIEQSLGYLTRIREGKVKTMSGRLIPQSEDVPGYCYILADLTPSMMKQAKMFDLMQTKDKLGYFGYNKNFHAYIEVISFDRLLNMATERNKAFFDKLGLPTS